MFLVIAITSISLLAYFFLKHRYEYWEKRGIPGPKPTFLVGNLGPSFMLKKSPFDIFSEIYNNYKPFPFVGIFKATVPTLLIRDPEVIKDVMVKSFRNFHDNDLDVDKKIDPILGRNPFITKGEDWKQTRTQLTPGFTSGKMKLIYSYLENNGLKMVKFISHQSDTSNKKVYETKQLSSRFTLNNVANCAFGIDAKGFDEDDNDLKYLARNFFKTGYINTLLLLTAVFFPKITKLFSIKLVNKDVDKKIIKIISDTVKYREDNKIIRNDFLNILMQIKKSCTDCKFTDIDVAAGAGTFFVDGYETTGSVLSFVMYDLAANPEAQKNLREELTPVFEEHNDKLPYETLQDLPILDAVVSESLRLHPPLFAFSKTCTETYSYTPKEGDGIRKPVVIEKGTSIVIPLSGLHNDPEYFEDPKTYKPERFMGSNKENIRKYTYMPFGEGPRTCLGRRFALLQIKVGIAYIIKHFKLSVNKKTIEPLQYDPSSFIIVPKGGLWIDFEKVV